MTLVIALSINHRPLSALELTLSGLIMGSRVDTANDNQNPNVIISNFYNVTLKALLNPLVPKHRMHCQKTFIFHTVTSFGKSNRKQGLILC